MCYQVIGGLLGDGPIWGIPRGGIMSGDQSVAVSAADADAAFGVLYAEHGPALLRLATALTGGDRGRAEDLVQETMLRAWTHRANLDIQHRSPRARPAEVELDEHLALAGGQRADASIDEVGVRAAIAALPGPQRQVLAEVYYRDRSVAETARILQIPPGTVKSRTFDGLRALRRALAAHDAVAQHSAATPSPGPPGRRPRPLGRPKTGVSRGTD